MSTIGKEFWVGFMENNRTTGAIDYAVILVTATENTTGVIEYLGNSVPFTLVQGQQFTFRESSMVTDLLHRTSGVIENKGIHITSSGKVAVHAFNERTKSADGTVVLPIGALGKDHYITSHFETNPQSNLVQNNESTLLVVSTEDNTRVEITLTENSISGQTKEVPYEITLNRGQSYQIKARGDLTGSRVRVAGSNADDCKKIAVFGGNKWTSVGSCGSANDHLYQQAYPVNTWGTSFIHTALAGRSSGELVKVLASEDNTDVRVNGNSKGIINKGQWIPLQFGVDESAKIETSKPSSVTVFSKSVSCNQPNAPNSNFGDPFMITYSPVEQQLTDITFNAINLPSIVNHYVNIVVKTGDQNLTRLDGQLIGSNFSALVGDPSFQIARIPISQGVHQLSNPSGFAAYVYGFGDIESYGYAAGAALNNLNFLTEAKYDFDVTGEKVACLNQEADWTINTENPNFTYFVWDFGDGTASKTGKDVSHKFTTPGLYEVKVVASLSPTTCDEQEEISFEVEVFEAKAEILGEQSVCPEVEEVMYRIKNKQSIGKTIFEVVGGEIMESFGDSVLVKWGLANPNALVRMIPFTPSGCLGVPIEFPVVINQRIVVTEALGPNEVCFDPSFTFTYSAPNPGQGRGYEWTVTRGAIVSGQGQSKIEVSWNQPNLVGTVEYTAYSLVDNSCEGKAPTITVKVSQEFIPEIETLTSVLCAGESTGAIRLKVTGGEPPYTFLWAHDSKLNQPLIDKLPAGEYSVKITDKLGCEKLINAIQITEPRPLVLAKAVPQGTSCYGKKDGLVFIQIQGGVPPYSINTPGENQFSSQIEITNLGQGLYGWKVIDSNGCSILMPFEITSPPALLVNVRMEKPACPGGSNGELLAFPVGGNAPYVYTWENQSGIGNQLIGVPKGNYNVSVTDQTGCVSLGTGEVSETSPLVRMPTGFNPREETLFKGVSNCEIEFQLWIYNRWGQLIYTGSSGWDGLAEGEEVQTGSYSYLMRYTFPLEDKIEVVDKRGTFALIR
jgi:PKD repeat protein